MLYSVVPTITPLPLDLPAIVAPVHQGFRFDLHKELMSAFQEGEEIGPCVSPQVLFVH
jgi:hypothetical protein